MLANAYVLPRVFLHMGLVFFTTGTKMVTVQVASDLYKQPCYNYHDVFKNSRCSIIIIVKKDSCYNYIRFPLL